MLLLTIDTGKAFESQEIVFLSSDNVRQTILKANRVKFKFLLQILLPRQLLLTELKLQMLQLHSMQLQAASCAAAITAADVAASAAAQPAFAATAGPPR